MKDSRVDIAKVLDPMLSKFLPINSLVLKRVWQFAAEGCSDRALLDFGQSSMAFAVDPDTDSIDFWVEDSTDHAEVGWDEVSRSQPWKNHIGKPFGWGWVTVNQQGYCDGVLLGFGNIGPHIVLNVVASSIKVGEIKSWR